MWGHNGTGKNMRITQELFDKNIRRARAAGVPEEEIQRKIAEANVINEQDNSKGFLSGIIDSTLGAGTRTGSNILGAGVEGSRLMQQLLAKGVGVLNERAGQEMMRKTAYDNPFIKEEDFSEGMGNRAIKKQMQDSASLLSYAVPVGGSLGNRAILGGASGLLGGFGQVPEGATREETMASMKQGAAFGAGANMLVSPVLNKVLGKIFKNATGAVDDTVRGTGKGIGRQLQEAGIDVKNQDIKKVMHGSVDKARKRLYDTFRDLPGVTPQSKLASIPKIISRLEGQVDKIITKKFGGPIKTSLERANAHLDDYLRNADVTVWEDVGSNTAAGKAYRSVIQKLNKKGYMTTQSVMDARKFVSKQYDLIESKLGTDKELTSKQAMLSHLRNWLDDAFNENSKYLFGADLKEVNNLTKKISSLIKAETLLIKPSDKKFFKSGIGEIMSMSPLQGTLYGAGGLLEGGAPTSTAAQATGSAGGVIDDALIKATGAIGDQLKFGGGTSQVAAPAGVAGFNIGGGIEQLKDPSPEAGALEEFMRQQEMGEYSRQDGSMGQSQTMAKAVEEAAMMALSAGDIQAFEELAGLSGVLGKMGGGTDLSAAADKTYRQSEYVLSIVDQVEEAYKELGTSTHGITQQLTGMGKNILGMAGADEATRFYNSRMEALKPAFARAMGEVGNLAEKEQEAAKDLLPKSTDSSVQAEQKLSALRQQLRTLQEIQLMQIR